MAKTIKTGILYRQASFDRSSVNKEARSVRLSLSSEQPVERWFGNESLMHKPESIRMDRIKDGPLLFNHDADQHLGSIRDPELKDGKLYATAVFSKSPLAEEKWQDVQDGHLKDTSIGYRVYKFVQDPEDANTYRATDWEIFEGSMVTIPADPGVGIGRGVDANQFETEIESSEHMNRNQILLDPHPNGGGGSTITSPAPAPSPGQSVADYQRQVGEILACGRKFDCMADAEKAIADGKTAEEFRKWILENKFNAKPVNTSPDVGMTRKEVKSWSLIRGLRQLANKQPLEGIEKDVNDQMQRMCGRETPGMFIPNEIVHGHPDDRQLAAEQLAIALLKRDLSAGVSAAGGYTIQTDVLGGSLIEFLRNQMVVFALGARKLGGLVGNVAIPAQSGGATAFWVAENAQTTTSNLQFGQVGLIPHRLSAVTLLGKMLLAQSSVDVEALAREDLAKQLAIAIDLAALAGTGNNGQPTGITNTSGIGSETFGAAATWAKILDFETQVANANALLGDLAYVTTPSARAKLKAAAKIGSTFPIFIWEGSGIGGRIPGEGEMNGYRAVATKQVPNNAMIFGNWGDLIVADWIGMDVVVDPYTKADTHQIKVTINMLADVGIRHAGSFVASTDSAAQ